MDELALEGSTPLKIKLFFWLCLKNKTLTWDVLGCPTEWRGFIGPRICSMCSQKAESVNHLLGDCNFFQDIWALLMNFCLTDHSWDGASLKENLLKWLNKKTQYSYLPVFAVWETWKARNASIFSNFIQRAEFVYLKILSSYS